MPDSRGAIIEILDRMTELGWVKGYIRNVKDNFVVDWTEEGARKIAEIRTIISFLGIKSAAPDEEVLWWAVLVLGIEHIPS
jgi:hypothetical protein